jgi:hypothetical protein
VQVLSSSFAPMKEVGNFFFLKNSSSFLPFHKWQKMIITTSTTTAVDAERTATTTSATATSTWLLTKN